MPLQAPQADERTSVKRFRSRTLHWLLAFSGLLAPAPPLWAAEAAPPLMLAKVYHAGISLPDYWVSEKFDGVRGYWDGEKLLTRGGERIAAPAWFTAGWPSIPMDGELWAGRGQFSKAVSTVRQQTPDDEAWRTLRFMVFDLPAQGGPFSERLSALNRLLTDLSIPWVQLVAQSKVASHAALQERLRKTVKLGGEGLMLHRGASLYKAQRNDDLLKVKTHDDSEARVVAHIPGKGKHAGQMGALLVEMPAMGAKPAQRFKLGTGFSDEERQNPPALGALVTYRFRGLNDSGIPRFASFMRVREELRR
ncbi:DNA ligase [Polaromonas sp.]|jgi:DNA ligase-1|uniref:DNA ligase n=1 Tax=Polaromonas sp. TaxID=1869339 RepID=UPI001D795D9F|nr:DNA ligase [Polaromonas sp.]MBT9475470.1 DNA ligase [Polaromonas sp.]